MDTLKELTKNNAFDTFCWQGFSDKDREDFIQLIEKKFPDEIIKDILLTSKSQRDSSSFISLDSGEIYTYLKKDLNVKCLLNVNLEKLPLCEHLIVFFKTKNPLEDKNFRDKLNKFQSWTYCTIPSKEESIDVITFSDVLNGVDL